jgi:ABC-type transport system involved in multi-copper enzyme maturation permease subunit
MAATTKQLPSHTQQVGVIFSHEIRKLLRSKRVIGVMVLAVLASVAIANFIQTAFEPTAVSSLVRIAIMFSPILMIIAGALVGSDSLLTEFHEKTGYSLFPNPVSRTAIWFGKFLAAELVIFIIIGIYYGIITLSASLQYGDISQEIFLPAPFLFSFLAGTMIMSISFLASSIFKGPIGATITVLFSLFVLPTVDGILTGQQIASWFTPSFATNNVYSIMLIPPNTDSNIAPFLFNTGHSLAESLSVIVAYTVGASIASIYFFKKRDM